MFRKKQAPTTTIPARDVRAGQVFVSSPSGNAKGGGAKVVRTSYRRDGEDGKPTVYIELADAPGWTFCLDPGEPVDIAA